MSEKTTAANNTLNNLIGTRKDPVGQIFSGSMKASEESMRLNNDVLHTFKKQIAKKLVPVAEVPAPPVASDTCKSFESIVWKDTKADSDTVLGELAKKTYLPAAEGWFRLAVESSGAFNSPEAAVTKQYQNERDNFRRALYDYFTEAKKYCKEKGQCKDIEENVFNVLDAMVERVNIQSEQAIEKNIERNSYAYLSGIMNERPIDSVFAGVYDSNPLIKKTVDRIWGNSRPTEESNGFEIGLFNLRNKLLPDASILHEVNLTKSGFLLQAEEQMEQDLKTVIEELAKAEAPVESVENPEAQPMPTPSLNSKKRKIDHRPQLYDWGNPVEYPDDQNMSF